MVAITVMRMFVIIVLVTLTLLPLGCQVLS